MSCKIKSIIDTSYLYKNGALISSDNVIFDIIICSNVYINIMRDVMCCNKRKFNRINVVVENDGINDIENGKLRVYVRSNNTNFIREFEIFNIKCKSKDIVYVDIPFCCQTNYEVKAQVILENTIFKEECISF